jgi:diguanylate cyclase (GGDEF)-like protein
MRLDLWTLIFVTVFVTGLLGGLLLFAWSQNRRITALSWWGAAFLLAAAGSCLLVARGQVPDFLSIAVANAVLLASYGFIWAGCRSFSGREPSWLLLLAGSATFFAFCSVPLFFASFGARVGLCSAVAAAYTLASAAEMWRGRAETLASRRPIIVLLVLHAAAMGSRPLLLWLFEATHEATLFSFPWITAHAFETLIATVLLSFLFLAIAKERVELEQRIMASCDPLTGIMNRRAFLARAERRLAASRPGEEAVLLLLDIDHFKCINDAHGHGTGDAVLQSFCRRVAESLPAGGLFARLGGEEFGCLLTGVALVEGFYAAEYLRNALALRPLAAEGQQVRVTVSIGLATSAECGHDLERLMSQADAALYKAKREGRNRVVCRGFQFARAA